MWWFGYISFDNPFLIDDINSDRPNLDDKISGNEML